jgi:hypothetical protein
MAAIGSSGDGDDQSWIAANSEPPEKFRPVMSGTSTTLKPFGEAWAPRTRAYGRTPSTTGIQSVTPRRKSGGEDEATSSCTVAPGLLISSSCSLRDGRDTFSLNSESIP